MSRSKVLGLTLAVAVTGLAISTDAVWSKANRREAPASANEERVEDSAAPRTILISLRKQRLRVLQGTREIANSRISSGRPGFDTPTGVFSILEKKRYHESNIYAGAPMPFMQRITWSGIALHAGVVPGYRASHGCIRLPHSFAKSMFGRTDIGGRVIVTQDEVLPVTFQHSTLFKPLPANDPPPAQGTLSDPARLAANDGGNTAGNSIANLISVSQAHAEEVVPRSKPRSRVEAERMRREKLERLAAELKAAEEAKAAATEKAKAAQREAEDADDKLKDMRKPFEDVLRAAEKAEDGRRTAAEKYRKYLNRVAAPSQDSLRDRVDDKEFELENVLLDYTVEADAMRAGTAEADLVIADAKAVFAIADAAKTQANDEVKSTAETLANAKKAVAEAMREEKLRDRQLSIFVSLKTQKLYIRQGFEPVKEISIEIDDPGSIGTHVLTALDYDQTGDDFVWQLVTAQSARLALNNNDDDDDDDGKKKKKKRKKSSEPQRVSPNSPMNLEAARAALDSIRIPHDVQDMIAELAKPGTSLIISERDLSHETGKGTEFVVLTR